MIAQSIERFILRHFASKLAQVGASQDMLHTFICNLLTPSSSVRHFFRLHSYDLGAKDRLEFWNSLMALPDRVAIKFNHELAYIEKCNPQKLGYLPYARIKEPIHIDSGFDINIKLPFVKHHDNPLFFPNGYSPASAAALYRALFEEEGITGCGCLEKSPHCYTSDNFKVETNDVVMDIGCAEALFALDSISAAKRIYAFEMLDCWKSPLKATFGPFGDKAKIIQKFVSDKTMGNETRIEDAILAEDNAATFFIKMDIEGGERLVLNASRDFLTSHKVKLAVATYHHQDDAAVLSKLLTDMRFSVEFSDGWMLPEINGHQFPYFRKGIIRAKNY